MAVLYWDMREPDAARSISMMSCHALKECIQHFLQREIVVEILPWEKQAQMEDRRETKQNETKLCRSCSLGIIGADMYRNRNGNRTDLEDWDKMESESDGCTRYAKEIDMLTDVWRELETRIVYFANCGCYLPVVHCGRRGEA